MTTHAQDIDRWTGELHREGWCIIPDALPRATIAALDADLTGTFDRTPFCEGGFYGETTKRFGRLLSRSEHTAKLVKHDLIMGVVSHILSPYCDTIQLNVTQAIAVHPGAPAQLPHRDQKRGSHASAPLSLRCLSRLTPRVRDARRDWSKACSRHLPRIGPITLPTDRKQSISVRSAIERRPYVVPPSSPGRTWRYADGIGDQT